MSRLMALGAVLCLAAMVACGGGAENQEAAGEQTATPPAAEAAMEGQQEMELPDGVTMEMVTQGKEIYSGAGLCYTCHGANGEGVPGLGANFTDGEWLHGDGSYEGISASVLNGVDTSASSTGTPMPPKGGSGITDDQAAAVAAYVWSISH